MIRRSFALLLALLAVVLLGAQPAQASARVRIDTVYFDSPGSDTGSNTSLNGEWIRLKNIGDATKNLSGWYIKDNTGYKYTFGSYNLRAGYTVHVHTGDGTNDGRHRFWGREQYVWNNTGDKAVLRNSAGTLIDTCSFSGAGSVADCL